MKEAAWAGPTPVRPNRKTKASVFEDLFSDLDNLLALYHVLHPEDTAATVNDLTYITLKNVLTRGQYNDLGFIVGDRLMILVEAQSTWSVNIIPRCIMYLAETWNRYFVEEGYDVYSSAPIKIPEPELYVIYTGDKKINKRVITLSEEFFAGKTVAVDASVNVLKYNGGTDIIDQYIAFCKILDEQRERYPDDGMKAVSETISICVQNNILADYLQKRKEEVEQIMTNLFDQEQATRMMLVNVRKEERAEGRAEGKEAQAKESAVELYRHNVPIEIIASSLHRSLDVIKAWVSAPTDTVTAQ